ncbi:endomucin isoform X1 [Rana temporaria]|uniref:endomucin isoform X1 n=1 Tax=Rana temporaria TaxID=8407 RepID=UPI001AAD0345|nr:endomucin isoform X1 [Rana temporaria]
MLERTMKTFGATAVFLAVINLLTVSSMINDSYIISPTPGLQNSSITVNSTPLISNSSTEPVKYQSSPKTGTSPSVTAVNAESTSTSRSPITSTVSTPTEKITNVSTSTVLNKDVNDSTVASVKASSAPPEIEGLFVTEATSPSIHDVPSKEASTMPSRKTQKPAINDEVPSKEPSTRPSVEPQNKPATNGEDSKDHGSSNSSGGTEKISATSNKGIKIGAGCVAAVIAVIVLVVIYKICQKKPPAAENEEEKACAETKENVKLLSVKTETPTDMKRTSSNQMESIEC